MFTLEAIVSFGTLLEPPLLLALLLLLLLLPPLA